MDRLGGHISHYVTNNIVDGSWTLVWGGHGGQPNVFSTPGGQLNIPLVLLEKYGSVFWPGARIGFESCHEAARPRRSTRAVCSRAAPRGLHAGGRHYILQHLHTHVVCV